MEQAAPFHLPLLQFSLGMGVPAAVEKAKKYITTAIEHSLDIGKGHGPTHHFYDLYKNGLNIG